jgi:hypothetical protein
VRAISPRSARSLPIGGAAGSGNVSA